MSEGEQGGGERGARCSSTERLLREPHSLALVQDTQTCFVSYPTGSALCWFLLVYGLLFKAIGHSTKVHVLQTRSDQLKTWHFRKGWLRIDFSRKNASLLGIGGRLRLIRERAGFSKHVKDRLSFRCWHWQFVLLLPCYGTARRVRLLKTRGPSGNGWGCEALVLAGPPDALYQLRLR